MTTRSRDLAALACSVLLGTAAGFVWIHAARAASALEGLERRVSALGGAGLGESSGPIDPRIGDDGGSRSGGSSRDVADLERELQAARAEIDGLRPLAGSARAGEGLPREELGRAVELVLAEMRREAVEQAAKAMATAMKGGAIRSIEMNFKFLGITEEQQRKMNAVFEEEAERCRLLLHRTDHRDAGYQAEAREIIERTDARIDAILTEEQRTKWRKLSPDFFGPGLDYERPARPK
jgi:hypothetical protein